MPAPTKPNDRFRTINRTAPSPAREPLMRLQEVLTVLDISRAAFYRMRARGKGPKAYKLPNGHLRFKAADFWAWFDQHAEETG